nr:sensor histidine kinase [Motilibacter deserti]
MLVVQLAVLPVALFLSDDGLAPVLQLLAVAAALALVSALLPPRRSLTVAAVALVAVGALLPGRPSEGVAGGLDVVVAETFLAVLLALAWLAGYTVLERRRHAALLREQATHEAVIAERLRIARELHDAVAHSIGVIAIQAGVGSRVLDTQPEEARNALTTIEQTSRETLAGLRRTVTSLRASEGGAGRDEAAYAPAPGLDGLERLVAGAADAGVAVELRWEGERRAPPGEIELAAYRIVQEAVTNVVRHAATDHCVVTVVQGEDALTVDVADSGAGTGTTEPGFGLVGMRERVDLLHGDLRAGPRAEGGFRVTARLPLPDGPA